VPVKTLTARFAARSVRCAQIPYTVATSGFIRHAHAAGLQVHVWTVNDAALMVTLLDRGADGIMTDQTEVLRDVLTARGQWQPRIGG
jgi:glycerophosphoryl diester phosphodiesterase